VPEDYVHRIGRTARAGNDGHAVSLVSEDEAGLLRDIEKTMRQAVPFSPTPHFARVAHAPEPVRAAATPRQQPRQAARPTSRTFRPRRGRR
jgi:ATP-dependent RNA helicase RhlE